MIIPGTINDEYWTYVMGCVNAEVHFIAEKSMNKFIDFEMNEWFNWILTSIEKKKKQ